MITNVSDQEHVKICVSSRPMFAFEEAFNGNPCLRLQDLNGDTIGEYVKTQLSGLVQQYVVYNRNSQHKAKRLLEMIVGRADGVFLWAVIATREVRDGLQGMVDLDQLAQAIQVLPPELEELFLLVLKHIKLAFRRDAARLLQIVLFAGDMQGFDLYRLYLISSQKELEDGPFIYENVPMSELSEGCRILEARLLSHTAGLLELTPGIGEHCCKREDWDPIAFTSVNFVHRTVRDFLKNNNEAKAFVNDHGLSHPQVHLCIARGTFAHFYQYLKGDAISYKTMDHPMLWSLRSVLRHVSQAERLSGRAQSKLIQSLDYAAIARRCTSDGGVGGHPGEYGAFSKDRAGTSIDIVGMAAAAGMTVYVCERLGLSVSSAGCNLSLADHDGYSKTRASRACLSWKTLDQLQDNAPCGHTPFRGTVYRQALSKRLQWNEDAQVEDESTEKYPLAESYILCCCEPTSIDLVRVLLKAGANPMVRVTPMNHQPNWPTESKTFWSAWLSLLEYMRYEYFKAHGESGGILFGGRLFKERHDRRFTLSDIFEVTKVLLAQGADINSEIYSDPGINDYLKRRDLDDHSLCFGMSASAIFLLEECFNNEPEFKEFAVAISPLIKQPTRKIVSMFVCPKRHSFSDRRPVRAADSKVLWPLIEKWERTGNHKDLAALQMAMEQIYNANALVSDRIMNPRRKGERK